MHVVCWPRSAETFTGKSTPGLQGAGACGRWAFGIDPTDAANRNSVRSRSVGRKKRLRKALGHEPGECGGDAPTPHVKARLEPFVCAHCGAPQPVGDADVVTCRGCGKASELPDAYRNMREAHRLSASDA